MKKELIAIFLLLVFILPILAYAQEKASFLEEMEKAKKGIIEKEKLLEKEVIIPENLKILTKIVFGLNENEEIDFSLFIVLIAIWLGLFSIIAVILKFLPFLNKGMQRFLGAIVITCLIAISGAIKQSAIFYLGFFDIFNFIAKYSILKFIIALFIALIFFYGVDIILGKIYSSVKLEESEVAGEKAGFGFKLLENFSKIWGKK